MPTCLGMPLFGYLTILFLDLQTLLQLLVQCVLNSLSFLVVGNLLMGLLLFPPLFLLPLLFLLVIGFSLLCVDDPLLFGLILADVFGYQSL